eukprot:scaffold107129_cov16-Tisochrysis_lutea.AAC.1
MASIYPNPPILDDARLFLAHPVKHTLGVQCGKTEMASIYPSQPILGDARLFLAHPIEHTLEHFNVVRWNGPPLTWGPLFLAHACSAARSGCAAVHPAFNHLLCSLHMPRQTGLPRTSPGIAARALV